MTTPFQYLLYGEKICSEFSLGPWPTTSFREARITIRKKPFRDQSKPVWYHQVFDSDDGSVVSSFAQDKRRFLIRMHRWGDFELSRNGSQITCFPYPDTSHEDLKAIIASQILPLAINLKGREVLHSCAVKVNSQALAFLGKRGAGKSTLTAAFVDQGFSMLSDDALPLASSQRGILAIPSVPEIRMKDETFQHFRRNSFVDSQGKAFLKTRTLIHQDFCDQPLALTGLYFLTPSRKNQTRISITPLSPRETWTLLLDNSFRLDLYDPMRLKRELKTLLRLAETCPSFQLSFPRRLELLPEIVKHVIGSAS